MRTNTKIHNQTVYRKWEILKPSVINGIFIKSIPWRIRNCVKRSEKDSRSQRRWMRASLSLNPLIAWNSSCTGVTMFYSAGRFYAWYQRPKISSDVNLVSHSNSNFWTQVWCTHEFTDTVVALQGLHRIKRDRVSVLRRRSRNDLPWLISKLSAVDTYLQRKCWFSSV